MLITRLIAPWKEYCRKVNSMNKIAHQEKLHSIWARNFNQKGQARMPASSKKGRLGEHLGGLVWSRL